MRPSSVPSQVPFTSGAQSISHSGQPVTNTVQTNRNNVFRKPNIMVEADMISSTENPLCTSNIPVSVSIGSNSNPDGYFLNMPASLTIGLFYGLS
jgi:hypothetical protein